MNSIIQLFENWNDTRFSHCLWEKVTFAPRKMWPGKRGLAPNCLGPFFQRHPKRVHECTETYQQPAGGTTRNKLKNTK